MTEPPRVPDPWAGTPWAEDESSGAGEDVKEGASNAVRAILRPSVILLIASAIVMFLSAVGSSNAPASSFLEHASSFLHRASMIAMLVAFIGILVAYRLPMLSASLENSGIKRHRRRWLSSEVQILLLASGLVLVWVWGTAWTGYAILTQVNFAVLYVIAGLLANMAILHNGTVRSFAIGVLGTILLVSYQFNSIVMAFVMGGFSGMGRRGDFRGLSIGFAIAVTLAIVSGLVCAFYHGWVEKVRANRTPPEA